MIVTTDAAGVDFFPASPEKEVWQNVRTILATAKFSVPLDRDFGIDAALVDLPLPEAKAKLSDEIIRAVNRYEPRARITEITFDGDADGRLKPCVRLEVLD